MECKEKINACETQIPHPHRPQNGERKKQFAKISTVCSVHYWPSIEFFFEIIFLFHQDSKIISKRVVMTNVCARVCVCR